MARLRRDVHGGSQAEWPRDPEPRTIRHGWARINGGAWPLLAATVAVVVAGYGWLGSVVDGAFGAVVGCAAGLILCALLYLLVESAVSGKPARGGRRD
ncbi:hypothetical protein FB563_0487 [Streptomyces puniciscabiei]|uniref:Uncharacterized protein n=1 Tax=Streptomyces puniciscabiei TaxID=164348 RepID=A0A542U948_9ACTN|nr:hypothetical protein [Streptomyces puniciscabiei]TQK95571.1 hypothetical protein FB563_0487 [Streptomyces puniciscabiei]